MPVSIIPNVTGSTCDYEIWINGVKVRPEEAFVSAVPFNRRWPGHQRGLEQTEIAWFLSAETDEPLRFEIRPKEKFDRVEIRPRALGITPEVTDGRIRFTLEKPAYFTVEPYGRHHALHFFVDPPADYGITPETPGVLYFGPGRHEAGTIRLQSNQTLYLAAGAVVYGTVLATDAENIRILGKGILDNSKSKETILFPCNAEDSHEDVNNATREHAIHLRYCENIEIDGITVRDSLCYTIRPFACRNVKINRVKIIGNWRYNSDGIDMHNCENVLIENCFLRTFDDSICVKGFDFYTENGVSVEESVWNAMHRNGRVYDVFRNVRVRNCTIWNDWGKALEIGAETRAEEITDIVFENCDIIHVTGPVLDCMNVDYADVHGITYRNINVEYDDVIPEMLLQKRDNEFYAQKDPDYTPPLCCVVTTFHHEYSAGGKRRGQNRDILFENINLWGRQPPRFRFEGYNEAHQSRDITVRNLRWNGKLLTAFPEEHLKTNEFTSNIRYETAEAIEKNTVAAANQLKEDERVRFIRPEGRGKRILFVGNSITLHGVNREIGWHHEWGMAASAMERDYVHLLMKKIESAEPEAAFCICQAAEWERRWREGVETYPFFRGAHDFEPDLIILRIIENCPRRDFDPALFRESLADFLRYLNRKGTAKVLVTTGFWHHPGDEALCAFAEERGFPCVSLGDLGDRDEMKAIGLFEHEGVANHPGDRGMEAIADRIFAGLKPLLNE